MTPTERATAAVDALEASGERLTPTLRAKVEAAVASAVTDALASRAIKPTVIRSPLLRAYAKPAAPIRK